MTQAGAHDKRALPSMRIRNCLCIAACLAFISKSQLECTNVCCLNRLPKQITIFGVAMWIHTRYTKPALHQPVDTTPKMRSNAYLCIFRMPQDNNGNMIPRCTEPQTHEQNPNRHCSLATLLTGPSKSSLLDQKCDLILQPPHSCVTPQ